MSIASRINEMTEHLRNDWNSIDKLGLDITEENSNDNLDKNIKNIAPVLNRFYNQSSDKTDLAKNGVVGRTTQNHTIPVEYTRVDYIESSGTQYIDTGVKANQDTITDVTLEINQFTEDYNVYFGSRYQFSSQAYELMSVYRPNYGIDPSIANTYNNAYVYTDIISTNTKYNIRKEKNVAYLDGNIIADQEYAEFETPVNMYIFATNSNGNANYKSSIRLYKMTISDGTNTLRDFIPCYRNSDNVVGLYDLVNDVFYTNQGTGVFTYGNIILEPSPDYPLEIKNLSGDVEYKVRGQGISEIFPLSLKSKNLWNITDYRNIDITDNARSTHSTTEDKIIINTGDTTYEGVYLKQVYQNIDNYNEQNVYYVSFDAVANQDLNFLYGESGGVQSKTTIGTQKVRLSQKYNPEKNLILYSISMRANDTIEISNIMISTSNDTTYEPYYDIELCNISDYKDRIYSQNGKFYLEKKTGKVVLDGSENWYINISYTYNVFYRELGNYARISNTQTTYCEYYKGIENTAGIVDFGNNYNNSIGVRTANDNIKHIYISNNSITSESDFKTWLSTHNTVVYYVLATPTTTEITQENYPTLYSQLLAIQEFLTKYKINKEFLLDYSSPEIEY